MTAPDTPITGSTQSAKSREKLLRKQIFALIDKPIQWSNEHSSIVASWESYRRDDAFTRYAEQICGHIPFNPWNKAQREAIIDLFAKESDSDPQDLAAIKDWLLRGEEECITIIGRRGSGKTLAINYLLAKYWEEISKRQIAVFRADVAKLNILNHETNRKATDPPVSILEYMQAHSYFIALRYANHKSKTDPLLVHFGDRGHGFQEYLTAMHAPSSVKELWQQTCDYYLEENKKDSTAARFAVTLTDNIIRMSADKTAPSSLFWYFIKSIRCAGKAYGKRVARTLAIVDGVDNILRFRGEATYVRLLGDLAPFTVPSIRKDMFDQAMIVMRNDTLQDIKQLSRTHPNEVVISEYPRYEISTRPVHTVFTKRAEAAATGIGDYVQKKLSKIQSRDDAFERQRQNLVAHGTEILSRLAVVARWSDLANGRKKQSRTSYELSMQTGFELLFNGNIRSFLRNIYRGVAYCHSHAHVSDQLPDERKRKLLRQLRLEGSILAGRNFFPSNADGNVNGRWCPNLFEWERTEGEEGWKGLMLLRVMQYVLHNPSKSTLEGTAETLSILFPYHVARLRQLILIALELGLLCYGAPVAPKDLGIELHKIEPTLNIPTLKATPKGAFVSALPFSSLHALYFMSLTILLDMASIKGASMESMRHNPNRDVNERKFRVPLVLASVALLRHINSAHRDEMSHLRQSRHPDVLRLYSQFSIPDLKRLTRELSFVIRTAGPAVVDELSRAVEVLESE